ncbi:unnamed protein product [Bursaphelenchus okinawaensis]|uniref:DUF4440 domain-containing protein n=1 Tax=Bursaphelenchus okinawaensis TaxID=465554 RepID=A0A811KGD5_9BILA|nr:unnamed protein product [Bursaphelenchus okinawaensis]CAG9102638.1 unnamed protein product [Bursaphelenchus okinawaensis]
MGFSTEEVEKLLQIVEKRQDHGFENKDLDEIASTYAENAVLIHKDNSVVRGNKAIADSFAAFFGVKFEVEKNAAYDINKGEYLMRKGRFRLPGKEWFNFMQLHEKQLNGEYLIIHDEFEFKQ